MLIVVRLVVGCYAVCALSSVGFVEGLARPPPPASKSSKAALHARLPLPPTTEWKMQRKIASNMFSAKVLREFMTPVFLAHAEALADSVARKSGGGAALDIQVRLCRKGP